MTKRLWRNRARYINVKQQLDGAVNFSKETFGKNRKGKIILCTAITPT